MIKTDTLPIRRRSWVQVASIPKARIGWELSDCKDVTPKDLEISKRWIQKVKDGDIIRAEGKSTCGKGLLIVGEPGHGKTTLAVSIIQEMLREFPPEIFMVEDGKVLVTPCYFSTFTSILDLNGTLMGEHSDEQERLFLGMHGECEDDAYNIRVLVVDDVGKEHTSASGWQRTVLHHLIRTRFNNGLPTIITTNLPISGWDAAYGNATESFIREAFAIFQLESIRGDLRR
jgi:DNA replication protein DnaC